MQRKKVNGNIIGARWQDIRIRGEIIAVNRRIGGLEIACRGVRPPYRVNRRIGGLEITLEYQIYRFLVNRRIGGLEKYNTESHRCKAVNRRIGGLENSAPSLSRVLLC